MPKKTKEVLDYLFFKTGEAAKFLVSTGVERRCLTEKKKIIGLLFWRWIIVAFDLDNIIVSDLIEI